jgi:3-deoxy-D-manno-octulosonic-acid transferase
MLSFYHLLTNLAAPLVRLWLKRRLAQGKEDGARLDERFGRSSLARPTGPLLWLHAASVGESVSTLPLIERLLMLPNPPFIVLTTGTVTSAELMVKRLPAGAVHQYVPVDLPSATSLFLDHWRPDLAIWIESEIWPNTLVGLRDRSIPAILLNARMSDKSFRRWQKRPKMAARLLSTFQICFAQTAADGERLRQLGALDVICAGNLKLAASPLPYDAAAEQALASELSDRPFWLAASTHEGEEEQIAIAHKTAQKRYADLLTILAPRHPARGGTVAALLRQQGLNVSQRSLGETINAETDVYLADTLGELGLFYQLSALAFVGGSLVPVGGHNPLEPAKLNCAILIGPHSFNFTDIVADFAARSAIKQIEDGEMLGAVITQMFDDPTVGRKLADAAALVVAGGDQIVQLAVKEVTKRLPELEGANANS